MGLPVYRFGYPDSLATVAKDSGGWESVCNKSVTPVHKPSWFAKLVEDLSGLAPFSGLHLGASFGCLTYQGVSCQPVGSTPLGVADLNLHSFLANSRTFKNARVSNHHLQWCMK